jgi:type IV pilus assembly protein PilY1
MTQPRRSRFLAALALLAALVHPAARAEDTDLFVNPNTGSSGQVNIMFILDNQSRGTNNSSTSFCNIDSSGNVSTTSTTANATALNLTSLGTMQCALYSALSSLSTSDTTVQFNISMMVLNNNGQKTFTPNNASTSETGGAFSSYCSGSDGGCVVVPLTGFTTNVKRQLLWWIKNWTVSNANIDSGTNGDCNGTEANCVIKGPTDLAHGAMMQEAWAYLKGYTGISGKVYTAPTTGCKSFIVFIGNSFDSNLVMGDKTSAGPYAPLNGTAGAGKNATPSATSTEKTPLFDKNIRSEWTIRKTVSGTTTTVTQTCSGTNNNPFYDFPGSGTWSSTVEGAATYGINWAQYMNNQHDIKTATIGLLGPTCKPDYPVWLDKMALAGGAQYYPANDYETLANAIKTITAQIISVNTVFASVSLPVSVNTQGSYLNQVYIGMFRPTSGYLPRWYGNLKQYKLAFISNVLKLVDADSTAAINTATGFLTECARSFWTPTSATATSYWTLDHGQNCSTISGTSALDYPDGNVVEKGGSAYMVRRTSKAPSGRTVKTCGTTMATCRNSSDLINFNTTALSAVSPTLFATGWDANYTAERDNLINFARGENYVSVVASGTSPVHAGLQAGDNEQNLGTGKYRASVHGDVMHSRPVAINYGNDTTPSVVVYYGANDGMLHAINGNQTGNIGSVEPGDEIWSFMPPEFYSKILRLYLNTEQISFRGSTNTSATAKDYGMDGPFTAFSGTIGGTAKKYIYATMRRGGRAIYGFDVTTAGSPALAWKAGCASASLATSSDCSVGGNDYSSMGQTWASARVFYANAHSTGGSPLLLMAGGYDTCEDTDTGSANHSCSGTQKGNLIYVLDATNGDIVASFPTIPPTGTSTSGTGRSIIGDPTIVNDDAGKAKYAYIADMGGVVYRIDFRATNKNDWFMKPIAKLGCGDSTSGTLTATCTANRKFMFQPSVVSADGVNFYILIGSGDREKPVSSYTVSGTVANHFYAIKDKPAEGTAYPDSTANSACGAAIICLAALQKIEYNSSATGTAIDGTKLGWYLTMESTEQVVTSAVTQFGITSFSTHKPAVSSTSCTSNLGTTRVYNISYLDATTQNSTGNRYEHVSGDGLPPSPVAGKVVIDGAAVPFCIGCSKDSPLEGKKAVSASSISRARTRLYWYLEKN